MYRKKNYIFFVAVVVVTDYCQQRAFHHNDAGNMKLNHKECEAEVYMLYSLPPHSSHEQGAMVEAVGPPLGLVG